MSILYGTVFDGLYDSFVDGALARRHGILYPGPYPDYELLNYFRHIDTSSSDDNIAYKQIGLNFFDVQNIMSFYKKAGHLAGDAG